MWFFSSAGPRLDALCERLSRDSASPGSNSADGSGGWEDEFGESLDHLCHEVQQLLQRPIEEVSSHGKPRSNRGEGAEAETIVRGQKGQGRRMGRAVGDESVSSPAEGPPLQLGSMGHHQDL